MMNRAADVKKLLFDQDEDFRHWAEEHHQYEDRLSELAQKSTLTPEEEFEEKQLKKRKLYLKDQMAAKIRGFELSNTA